MQTPLLIPINYKEAKMQNRNDHEGAIYSDDLLNIIGRTPSWILRWGNAMFLLFILGFVFISFIIRYPEIIRSKILITTPIPPVSIVALSSGQIDKLFVKDHQAVLEGEILGILKSPTVYEDVNKVKACLSNDTIPSNYSQEYKLGSIQNDYNNYVRAYREFVQFDLLNPYKNKISKLRGNLSYFKNLMHQIDEQTGISRNELNIIQNQFEIDSLLYQQKAIAKRDYEVSNLNYLSRKTNYQNNKQSFIRTQIQHKELNNLIAELHVNYENEQNRLRNELNSTKKQLESSISIWESNFILRTPMKGVVSFFNYWTENQFVKASAIFQK